MKVLQIILFIQVLALAKFCNANKFGGKTFESVFLNKNPPKDIKGTSKVSGDFQTYVIELFLTFSSVH